MGPSGRPKRSVGRLAVPGFIDFALKPHLCRHRLTHLITISVTLVRVGPQPGDVDRIPTSANWNVAERPWLTSLVPILISLSRKLVSDHGSAALGIVSRPHEVADPFHQGRAQPNSMAVIPVCSQIVRLLASHHGQWCPQHGQ